MLKDSNYIIQDQGIISNDKIIATSDKEDIERKQYMKKIKLENIF